MICRSPSTEASWRTTFEPSATASAGVWVDRTSRLEVIWLVGDVSSEETAAIEQAARPMNVCVVDGARYSAADLEDVSAQIVKFEGERLIQTDGGHGTDVAGNVVVVPLQSISPHGRAAVDALGPRVVAIPFIELLDRDLSSLPKYQPPLIADLEILTQSSRGGLGLKALATFTLHYDSSEQCVYLTALESDTRVAPVWPYGYSVRQTASYRLRPQRKVCRVTRPRTTTCGRVSSSSGRILRRDEFVRCHRDVDRVVAPLVTIDPRRAYPRESYDEFSLAVRRFV